MPLTLNITLPGEVQNLKKMKRLSWISTWKLCQSWDWRSTTSSRGWLKAQGRRIRGCPPQNPWWRSWRVGWPGEPRCMTCLAGGRNWLRFLGWMTMRNWHRRCRPLLNSHSRSANGTILRITIRPNWHHCAFVRSFLPLPDSKFACWDIRELQQEKTVAYAQALQFWVEKSQSAYSGPTMPFGGEHNGAQGGDEMLCFFHWWGHLQCCGSPGGTLDHLTKGSCPWECPTNTDQLPCQGGHCKGNQGTN